ncbi:polyketide cyclase [Mycobacterium kyorinense]|uniref:Polyketide cyclase n=1 Tax=Mycobacterium kyorinense TaxID=487514 RepID=A0A1A2ZQ62_9MYCO|nr:polyketide cyclase [Mycobacterium kyorinense]OBI51823.1 polyketide cyclase [Mycobacterium kyorinense]
MTDDVVSEVAIIDAPATTVFRLLADPATHAAIDGTGWVREALDGRQLAEVGQIFRMAMYHDNHPTGTYEMANQVIVFEPPRAIAWKPGQDIAGDGSIEFGGWIWRYDLAPVRPSETQVSLTYDWSAVSAAIREHIQFPPFALDHLKNSLLNLGGLAAEAAPGSRAISGINDEGRPS